jgi:hypothetical protein
MESGHASNASSRRLVIDNALIQLRQRLSSLPPPVIVYNKSHSGSRLLVRALEGQGLFMGAERNESEDAIPIVPIVEACVLRYYPDFGQLWASHGLEVADLAAAMASAFERHLVGYDPTIGRQWGWKLCETLYALPFFAFLFPQAKVIHLVRDGRDVAWSDHVAPELPFWRKVYFNTEKVQHWRGRALTNAAYERASHLYNALHWMNSVEQGRAYGNMLGERYKEVRYETLCADCTGTMASLLDWLGVPVDSSALDRLTATIYDHSIGKHRNMPRRKNQAVLRLVEPTLASLGYLVPQPGGRGLFGLLAARLRLRSIRAWLSSSMKR